MKNYEIGKVYSKTIENLEEVIKYCNLNTLILEGVSGDADKFVIKQLPIVSEESIKACKINEDIHRLEELRKDFEQDRLGLVVPNIEQKKTEYITLLQEVRMLQGKMPRNIKANY